jgi:hypothetical protein
MECQEPLGQIPSAPHTITLAGSTFLVWSFGAIPFQLAITGY